MLITGDATGQSPQQKAVASAEGEFSGRSHFAGAGQMVQYPLDLGAGKAGVEEQAGLGGDLQIDF